MNFAADLPQISGHLDVSIFIGLVTIIFSSPVIIEIGYTVLFLYQKKRKYPNLVALLLSNGQWYFGRISKISRTDLRLEDIYYLNTEEDYDQENQRPSKGIELIKLGNELHGPEDFMLINRQHILFLENLKPGGQVAKAIEEYRRQNT